MQAITLGKCTLALRHCANRYYMEKKSSADRLRGTIFGNTWMFFYLCYFILRNWLLFWENYKWWDLITCNKHIKFSKADLIKWKIPLKLLKLCEIPNASLSLLLTYQQENNLGKDPENPIKPEAGVPVQSFFMRFYSNIFPLTSMGKK